MKLKIGIILMILSAIFYLSIAIVPFFDVTTANKAIVITTLIILGEASFYIGLFYVGKVVWLKYKQKIRYCFFSIFTKRKKIID